MTKTIMTHNYLDAQGVITEVTVEIDDFKSPESIANYKITIVKSSVSVDGCRNLRAVYEADGCVKNDARFLSDAIQEAKL